MSLYAILFSPKHSVKSTFTLEGLPMPSLDHGNGRLDYLFGPRLSFLSPLKGHRHKPEPQGGLCGLTFSSTFET